MTLPNSLAAQLEAELHAAGLTLPEADLKRLLPVFEDNLPLCESPSLIGAEDIH